MSGEQGRLPERDEQRLDDKAAAMARLETLIEMTWERHADSAAAFEKEMAFFRGLWADGRFDKPFPEFAFEPVRKHEGRRAG